MVITHTKKALYRITRMCEVFQETISFLQNWKQYSPPSTTTGTTKWPRSRGSHVASCLIDPESDEAENEQYIAVFWGQGERALHVPDIWILHVQKMEWKEVIFYIIIQCFPPMFPTLSY